MPSEVKKTRLRLEAERVAQEMGLSPRTTASYLYWCRKYWLFSQKRDMTLLKAGHVERFLIHLATKERMSASTQNLAQCALLFLYRQVLHLPSVVSGKLIWAKRGRRLPTILSQDEVRKILQNLSGIPRLMAGLLYGSGLRVAECVQLRVADIDLRNNTIQVRDTGDHRARETMLPTTFRTRLQNHLAQLRLIHLARCEDLGISPAAAPWQDQYVFQSDKSGTRSGVQLRSHVSPQWLQRAVKAAIDKAQITKQISCQSLRYSFAVHLLEDGCHIREVQKLMGHKSVRTTLVYDQMVKYSRMRIRSPLDKRP